MGGVRIFERTNPDWRLDVEQLIAGTHLVAVHLRQELLESIRLNFIGLHISCCRNIGLLEYFFSAVGISDYWTTYSVVVGISDYWTTRNG